MDADGLRHVYNLFVVTSDSDQARRVPAPPQIQRRHKYRYSQALFSVVLIQAAAEMPVGGLLMCSAFDQMHSSSKGARL